MPDATQKTAAPEEGNAVDLAVGSTPEELELEREMAGMRSAGSRPASGGAAEAQPPLPDVEEPMEPEPTKPADELARMAEELAVTRKRYGDSSREALKLKAERDAYRQMVEHGQRPMAPQAPPDEMEAAPEEIQEALDSLDAKRATALMARNARIAAKREISAFQQQMRVEQNVGQAWGRVATHLGKVGKSLQAPEFRAAADEIFRNSPELQALGVAGQMVACYEAAGVQPPKGQPARPRDTTPTLPGGDNPQTRDETPLKFSSRLREENAAIGIDAEEQAAMERTLNQLRKEGRL